MSDLWYPDGIHDPAPEDLWGTHSPGCGPKFLLHTTEGGFGVYSPDARRGDARRYFGHTWWPTYTLARRVGSLWRVFQHMPANRSARALENDPNRPPETNRGNVSQVEIAWKAAEIAALPGEALDQLAKLLAWEHAARGVPLTSSVRWVGPGGFGAGAPQRLSGPAWTAYAGVLGHQHAPENAHWDPGEFPIEALLSRAREIAGGDGDVAIPQDVAQATVDLLQRQAWERPAGAPDGWHPPRQASVGAMLRRDYEMIGEALDHAAVTRRLIEGIAAGNAEVLLYALSSPDELDRLAALASARADELRPPSG